jgi:hypothetical protein
MLKFNQTFIKVTSILFYFQNGHFVLQKSSNKSLLEHEDEVNERHAHTWTQENDKN